MRIVADQRGCPTSTLDLAEAVLSIAPRLIAGEDVWGTYHFAGSGVTTWHGFASRIVAAQAPLTGRAPRMTPITTAEYPLPARRPANSELDSSLFARIFGIRARPWTEETDRITAMATELAKIGARIEAGEDWLEVTPPERFMSGTIDTYDDHRMAMCLSLAAFGGVPVTINDPGCVRKTFPAYFDALAKLTGVTAT